MYLLLSPDIINCLIWLGFGISWVEKRLDKSYLKMLILSFKNDFWINNLI